VWSSQFNCVWCSVWAEVCPENALPPHSSPVSCKPGVWEFPKGNRLGERVWFCDLQGGLIFAQLGLLIGECMMKKVKGSAIK
jgi:hypothetical protein